MEMEREEEEEEEAPVKFLIFSMCRHVLLCFSNLTHRSNLHSREGSGVQISEAALLAPNLIMALYLGQ